ncbi:MAG: glycosyltransferase [Candidatus Omnitrophica bacterium]|nr:glycosyltransferase [Candidatus Omnitrophota bacterium]
MRISIIVPAFNEETVLIASLRSIRSAAGVFARLGWEHELIVCDNNSSDGTARIAREEGATVVFEPINQIARARNKGAEAATGEWFVFIDADSQPSKELFQEMALHAQNPRCLGGGTTIRFDEQLGWAWFALAGWNLLSRTFHWMAGSFIFCRAEVFRQMGGFNLELFASEEIDFSRRLKRLARRRRGKIVILHRHPLLTSARKLHLYSRGEYFNLVARTVLERGNNLKNRSNCQPWYDGRR